MIEILTIGDELISGKTLDENAHYIAAALHAQGFIISRITSVGDGIENICRALRDRLPDTRFMVITGGLGPTDDDRTAQAAAKAFGTSCVLHPDALSAMERAYAALGRTMPEAARKQALLPQGSILIPNPVGTACGFCITHDGVEFIFLPGVPEEVRAMTEGFVINHVRTISGSPGYVLTKQLTLFGLWESGIKERLTGRLPDSTIVTVGYYPQFPDVTISITGRGLDVDLVRHEVEQYEAVIMQYLGPYVYATTGERLEEIVGRLLLERTATLAVAESCTGGLITHRLTNVPGSSAYLERAYIVYSNRAKHELLAVPEDLIERYGAVSEQVARSMAIGARGYARTTYGLAVTGIAGPSGGNAEKPVGTVFVGIASDKGCEVVRYRFSGSREKIKIITAHTALNALRLLLLTGTIPQHTATGI
ncbi:MAG: CinA family nicotinamide mononucleotide deamidase-related protein [Desulfobacterota bacterium]|nr:CinA family nicotinamide mononucleotide deamidase-related protein [Thermodesulfobacteriota bacterium]